MNSDSDSSFDGSVDQIVTRGRKSSLTPAKKRWQHVESKVDCHLKPRRTSHSSQQNYRLSKRKGLMLNGDDDGGSSDDCDDDDDNDILQLSGGHGEGQQLSVTVARNQSQKDNRSPSGATKPSPLKNIKPRKHRMHELENPWIVPSSRLTGRDPLNFDLSSIFEMLWEKATPASADTFQSCPGIQLADTITYTSAQYSQPQWYFTSQQDGRLYKKNAVNVTPDNIYRVFTKKKLGTTVRRFMDHSRTPVTLQTRTPIVAYGVFEHVVHGTKFVTTEYFDARSLRTFVEKHAKEVRCGFIQKYLHSGGAYSTCLRVQWTPHGTMIEQIKNRNEMSDESVPLKDRMTVEWGDPNTIIVAVISPVICAQIDKLCQAIVRHIHYATLSYHQVREMSLVMKTDCHNRIWLLWFHSLNTTTQLASPERPLRHIAWKVSLRAPMAPKRKQKMPESPGSVRGGSGGDDRSVDNNDSRNVIQEPGGQEDNNQEKSSSLPLDATQPLHLNMRLNSAAARRKKKLETFSFFSPSVLDNKMSNVLACPSCGKLFDIASAVRVCYLVGILEHEQIEEIEEKGMDHARNDEAPGSRNTGGVIPIPPIIKLLEPYLGPIRYRKSRDNPNFLSKVFKVCTGCASRYGTTAKENGINLLGETIRRPMRSRRINRPATIHGAWNDSSDMQLLDFLDEIR